ncbi:MAG: NAD(P)-dependent dehydrogenase (short-subunit alcohol dehydrogenase family) [Paracoccaceae bacterium]|jgi:NAD(P)-dependent dehydrogenase (short-subunit alcohol dehydrogenase family)
MDMTSKTVLITGASRGIGGEAARVFAAVGANVVLLARSKDSLQARADEIGNKALALAGDVSSYGDMQAAVQACVDTFGGLDVLIGNAGVIEPISRMATADPEGWAQAIDINLKGVFYGMRAALPVMHKAGGGTILTVSSGAAHGPIEGWSHYCASKAGAAMLTSSLDQEERENGIRAMGLSPGTVATQMQRDIKSSGINRISEMAWEDHVPADWPARALLWMCSPDADEYVGSEISLRDEVILGRVGLQ